jgi:hypothetical protein
MPSGVFGLGKIYKKQRKKDWPESANYGYSVGTTNPVLAPPTGGACIIDRLDLSTEVVSSPGSIANYTYAMFDMSSLIGRNYGYLVGGKSPYNAGVYCTIVRLDFSNETFEDIGTHLNSSKQWTSSVNSPEYGYVCSGRVPTPADISTIDRLDFSSETLTSSLSNLTTSRTNAGSTYSTQYGYIAAGFDGTSNVATIDRFDFTNESSSVISGTLNNPGRTGLSQHIQSQSYGYVASGSTFYPTVVDRIDFSNDSFSRTTNITVGRGAAGGASTLNYGYLLGGKFPYRSDMDRIDFSTDSVSTPSSTQTLNNRGGSTVIAGGINKSAKSRRYFLDIDEVNIGKGTGYFVGGYDNTQKVCTIDRMDYSNEVVDVPSVGQQITQARNDLNGISNRNFGYFAGGLSAPAYECTIDRLDFSNETVAATGQELTQARYGSATATTKHYGYFAGGRTAPGVSVCSILRMDFSTEIVSEPGVNLSDYRHGMSGVSTRKYAYFTGGQRSEIPLGHESDIDRMDFSSETLSTLSATLPLARRELASIFDSNYGYFAGGGRPPGQFCTIDRLDFSNETTSAPSGSLTDNKTMASSVFNRNYGYFAGGLSGPSTWTCLIDRMDFATETVTAPGPSLTQARAALGSVSGGWATAPSIGPRSGPRKSANPGGEGGGGGGGGGGASSQMTFKYYGYGSNTGTLSVHWAPGPPTSNTISAALPFTADGATVTSISGPQHPGPGQAWKSATVDLSPLSPSTGHFVFKYRTGTSFRGDFQLDDMEFTHSGGTDDLDPDLKRTASTDNWQKWNAGPPATYNTSFFSNVVVSSSAPGGWNYDAGGTPSGSTGTTSDSDGSTTGYYIYAETSSPNYPQKYMWLRTANPVTI